MTNFGPTGQVVYERTYSRTNPDGTKEQWEDTVRRVVDGNLALIDDEPSEIERGRLIELMTDFKVIPAGRHLWASGVPGRQYLFNCWVAPWGFSPWEHFSFTFLRLMEGGGVGANYSNHNLVEYGEVTGWDHGGYWGDGEPIDNQPYEVHIVCDPQHEDYDKLVEAGVLSHQYADDWAGAFEVEDSREGWAEALVDLIQTYYRPARNQNRVFDISRVRPEGARLKTFGGRASGPLPLAVMLREVADVMNRAIGAPLTGLEAMAIDHAIAKCVVSGGVRRSARMSIMRWDDPQIFDFIVIKALTGEHWTTNISVEVDHEFWRLQDGTYVGDSPERVQHAKDVLSAVADGMLVNGEPGIWNSELSNYGEPRPVVATNPCGEIPLMPYEPCNLGHVNLAGFVKPNGEVDWIELAEAHRLMTRFLIRGTFADVNDPGSRQVLDENRRIGVGHLGVASFLALTGLKYSEAPDNENFISLLQYLAGVVDDEAAKYSHWLRIPVPVKKRTVAPTGTIAKMPGVSEGIHPIFAKYFIRRVRFSDVDPEQVARVEQFKADGFKTEPCQYAPLTTVVEFPTMDSLMQQVQDRFGWEQAEEMVESAAEIKIGDMLRFQEMYQSLWADNAVSYTVNFDPGLLTVDHIEGALKQYGPRLKGSTLFPEMSMPQSPYQRLTVDEFHQITGETFMIADSVDENCTSGACPVR